jgi:hypothetical protein
MSAEEVLAGMDPWLRRIRTGVEHDRSADVTAPEREVVQADGAGLGRYRGGQGPHPARQRGTAGCDARDLGKA